MRLARVLAGLLPREPEVHGLVALTELQASRFAARVGADGEPVLLQDQDRRRGTEPRSARQCRAGTGRRARPPARAPIRCRPRSPGVMPGRHVSRTPIGRRSSPCTTRWRRWRRRRWWNSIVRWRCCIRTGPRPRSLRSMPCGTTLGWRACTSTAPCGAKSSNASAATARRPGTSRTPRRPHRPP